VVSIMTTVEKHVGRYQHARDGDWWLYSTMLLCCQIVFALKTPLFTAGRRIPAVFASFLPFVNEVFVQSSAVTSLPGTGLDVFESMLRTYDRLAMMPPTAIP
jgi:hypothetical protein